MTRNQQITCSRSIENRLVSTVSGMLCLLALILLASTQRSTWAQEVVFPSDAGLINVKDYGARGDGVADDSDAIQNAMIAARGYLIGRTVYFPNGTYRVTRPLIMTNCDNNDADGCNKQRMMSLQGQSEGKTIIQLANNASGYNDKGAPRGVIVTFQPEQSGSDDWSNSAFTTNIRNLTVNTGSGNAGAVGIIYVANNQSTVREVTIRTGDGNGFSGLDMAIRRIPGPALFKNVTIEGFDYGIRTRGGNYSNVFENITLRNQRVLGISNADHVLTIRKLTSVNSVPAIRQVRGTSSVSGRSSGVTVLIDSNLTGGSAANPALDITDGFLFARNVQTSGYGRAINDHGTGVAGPNISEFRTGNRTYSLFDSPETSMNLEIRETPNVAWDNPNNRCRPANVPCAAGTWANVRDFGATQGSEATDDTAAIQAAIDSGATTVYFPNTAVPSPTSWYASPRNAYNINGTIEVRGAVRRLIGGFAPLRVGGGIASDGGAVFKVVNGSAPTVVLENVFMMPQTTDVNAYWAVEQASTRTLVAKHISIRTGHGFLNTANGDTYLEDFHALTLRGTARRPLFTFRNLRVWARQLNPEGSQPQVLNDGGTVWILGEKNEQKKTVLETRGGGRSELLGGLAMPVAGAPVPTSVPAFINNESHMSVVHTEHVGNDSSSYFQTIIRETRGGVTREFAKADLPSRPTSLGSSGSAYVIPLYTGYEEAASPELNATADAYVRSGQFANTNYGSATVMEVKTADAGGNYARDAYLKFDTKSISTISSAKLRINAALSSGSTPIATAVYPVANLGWSETGITWNNRPALGTTALGSVSVGSTSDGWYEVDVTEYVRVEKAAGRNVVSFALRNEVATQRLVRIGAREAGASGPQLVITP